MNDTDRFPIFLLFKGKLIPTTKEIHITGYQYHHYVEKKLLKKYPSLLKHQKLIYMPNDCNYDIDKRIENFKHRWGIELKEVVYLGDKDEI
jgi:hypothetical protein